MGVLFLRYFLIAFLYFCVLVGSTVFQVFFCEFAIFVFSVLTFASTTVPKVLADILGADGILWSGRAQRLMHIEAGQVVVFLLGFLSFTACELGHGLDAITLREVSECVLLRVGTGWVDGSVGGRGQELGCLRDER